MSDLPEIVESWIGERRHEEDGEFDVDASGTLPSGATFSGAVELVKILKSRDTEIAESLTRKMLTYALGRGLEYYDRCAVDEITTALLENDYRFSVLVNEIVNSEPVRMRRGDDDHTGQEGRCTAD